MYKSLRISVILVLVLALITPLPVFSQSDGAKEVLSELVGNKNIKGRILWYDLSANLDNLNTPEKVADIVEKTANANIDTIILDVKNYTGYVGYLSDYAPHISQSNIPGYDFPEGYDLLEQVLKEAKKHDLEVLANVNVFSEGNNHYEEGPAFQNQDWMTEYYMVTRLLETESGETHDIHGTNIERQTNMMVLYTPDQYDVVPTNRWGLDVQVTDGVITQIADRVSTGGGPIEVPENGVVISAHGEARQWVLNHLSVGESVDYNASQSRFVKAKDYPTFSTFVNPLNDEVENYELNIIEELITNYDIDGIVLDRARYSNQYADFSDLSRQKFEEYIGQEVENWPEDIFEVRFNNFEREIVEGKWYKKWIEFRAHNIQSFFIKAEELVHNYDEDLFFTTYVGSWYPLYYSEGVNWASQTYHPDYDWASEDYHKTGYAEYLDFLMTGNYFEEVTIEEAEQNDRPAYWYSVEGSADIAMEATNYATLTYGSLYLLQYQDRPEKFREAIRMVEDKMHGIMLFDLVYIEMYDWWDILEEEFSKDTKAPHQIPGIMELIR